MYSKGKEAVLENVRELDYRNTRSGDLQKQTTRVLKHPNEKELE
jgi:hypothetical protein